MYWKVFVIIILSDNKKLFIVVTKIDITSIISKDNKPKIKCKDVGS